MAAKGGGGGGGGARGAGGRRKGAVRHGMPHMRSPGQVANRLCREEPVMTMHALDSTA